MVKGRDWGGGWGNTVKTPAESAALKWELHATSIDGGLGACVLWSPDERMCEFTPPPELLNVDEYGCVDLFEEVYGPHELEGNEGRVYDESAICAWSVIR